MAAVNADKSSKASTLVPSTYKENLLINARYQMEKSGGSIRVTGTGNDRRVQFKNSAGRICSVWFPVEPRVKDLEVIDIKNAITEMSGFAPFAMPDNYRASNGFQWHSTWCASNENTTNKRAN